MMVDGALEKGITLGGRRSRRLSVSLLEATLGDDATERIIARFGGYRLPNVNSIEILRRNRAICAHIDSGLTYETVARLYGMSVSQIKRIGKTGA